MDVKARPKRQRGNLSKGPAAIQRSAGWGCAES